MGSIEETIETGVQTGFVIGALILILGFFWLLWAISPKLLGLFFLAAGVFIAAKFPGMSDYEKPQMTNAVLAIGVVLVIIGILLIGLA